MDLTVKHADYTATEAIRVKARDFFEGIEHIIAASKLETYLLKAPNETTESYDYRKAQAVLDPYAEKIIAARQALLFQREHGRTLPSNLEQFLNNVDGQETAASTFFEQVAEYAQVDGIAWVLIDADRIPDGEAFASRAAQAAAGWRPFFVRVPGASVIDWEEDSRGALLWAVIQETASTPRGETGWGETRENLNRWKIWTRSEWIVYEESNTEAGNGTETKSYSEVDRGSHGLGVVPLVPFFGEQQTNYSGLSVLHKVLQHIMDVFNRWSDLGRLNHIVSRPIPYVIGPKHPETLNTAEGLYVPSTASNEKVEIGLIEPTGAGAACCERYVQESIFRMISIALAQSRKDTAQVQAADTIKEDRKIFSSSLKTCSYRLERQEERCWEYLAKWMGAPEDAVDIRYSRDWDDTQITEQMLKTFSDMVERYQLPLRLLLQQLQEHEIISADEDIESILLELEGERDQAAMHALQSTFSASSGGATDTPNPAETGDTTANGEPQNARNQQPTGA